MNINASDRTLGLLNIWQVVRKLDWEVELMKSIPGTILLGAAPENAMQFKDAQLYAAINAASTSVALVDWLYHLAQENSDVNSRVLHKLKLEEISTIKSFRRMLREKHEPLNICHQICNSNKHLHLSDYDSGLKILIGDIIFERPDGTEELSVIAQVLWSNGTSYPSGSVFNLLDNLRHWWKSLITEINAPEREIFYPDFAP